ncbi:MAG: serine/threonine protein kinase [Polyangiaceae bacterium]|nr:serine/threonine protein kinase [Polyangiaceae bacterium]
MYRARRASGDPVSGASPTQRATEAGGVEWFAVKRALPGATHDREAQNVIVGEAELLSKLDHPGIVRMRDAGSHAGVAYVAYDLVEGVDLERLLAVARERGKTLPLDAALTIAIRVAEALAYVHAFGQSDGASHRPIVHRDVGPSNVLIGFDGRVKLADFGIAKVPGRNSTTGVGEIKGTIRYMAPEQVRAEELDPRTDQYGLGAVLLEMATGRAPFEGRKPVEILQELAKGGRLDPDVAAPTLPETMREVLRKVLAPHVAERYHTSAKLLEALHGLVQKLGVQVGDEAVLHVVGELFPARAQAKTFEESHSMAEDKGSDLDVFEGLAKKSVRSQNLPIPASSPPTSGRVSGLPAPVPPPPSMRSGAKSTLLGVPVPALPPGSTATPMPLPPPSAKPPVKTLVGTAPSPSAPPSAANLPPPSGLPPPVKSASAPPLPPPASAPPKAPPPPSTLVAAVPPPPKPPASIGAAVGLPSKPHDDGTEEKTPPAGVPVPKKADGASLDMDWEEEEESTHVFEKKKHGLNKSQGPRPAAGTPPPSTATPPQSRVGLAGTLLMSSGASAAPRSVPPPVLPPPPAVPQQAKTIISEPTPAPSVAAAVPAVAPASHRKPSEEPTIVRQREGSSGRLGVILGGLALVAVVGLIVYLVLPRKGDLKITITSKTGQAIAKAEIYVDGKKLCDTTPCLASGLDAGSRSVRVIINDQVVADQTAKVEPGREESVTISIDGGPAEKPAPTNAPVASATTTATAAPVVVEGTGFKISGPKDVKISVDGKDKGVLGSSVFSIKDLPPGEHTIKLDGGETYKSTEKKITVVKDKMEDLGEHKPQVLKGVLTLELKTDGAQIQITGERNGKKFDKKLTAAQLDKPIAVPTDEGWKITATKKGFEDFEQEVKFDDGVAEKTLNIELAEKGKPAPAPGPLSTGTPPTPATGKPTATATSTAAAQPPSGNGTLSMNSIPISAVILDGVPVGKTPISGRSVSAGSHTVTFRHPEKGTKTVTVTVKPGGKAAASVKFD